MRKKSFVLIFLVIVVYSQAFYVLGLNVAKNELEKRNSEVQLKTVTQAEINLPEVQVFLNDTLLKTGKENISSIVSGDKIRIVSSHKDDIDRIHFSIDDSALMTMHRSEFSIPIFDSHTGKGTFTVTIFSVSKTNICSSLEQYIFEMK